MIIEVGTFEIDYALTEEFEPVVKDISRAFATADICGLRSFTFARSIDRPARYVVLVQWDSVADHQKFTESDEGIRQRELLKRFIVGSVDIDHYPLDVAGL